ncbi:coiled-coil and C2 domain-containing protein 1B-like [Mytilus edulis]|uniref:coiled-coil and C2 domain-containing protein 1B-like n=1 Tax=Mytilus edulis TaxID=6550 RepID=UPI0039EE2E18
MPTELSSDGSKSLEALRKRFLTNKSEASPPKKSCVKPDLKMKEIKEDIQVQLQIQILDKYETAVKRVFPTSEDILSGKISITVPIKSTGVYWMKKVNEYFQGNYKLQIMTICSSGYSVVDNPEDFKIANLKFEMKKFKKKAGDLQAYIKFVDKDRSQLKKLVTCNQSQREQERPCVKKDKDHVPRVTESRTTSTIALKEKSIEMKIRKEGRAIKAGAIQAEYESLSSDEDTALQLTSQEGGNEDKVLILVERLSMYESGVQSAKSAGDTSKQKKYGTALKTIQDLLLQAQKGKVVDESGIPPRIPEIETELMIETKRDQYKTTALKPKQPADTHTATRSKQPSASASPSPQQILRFNNEPTSPSHEIETEQMIETKRDQYKTTALKPKQSADTHTATRSKQPSASASPSPQQILRFNNEPTSPSHEIETEQMIETKRDQYKTTALKPKQSADTHTATRSKQPSASASPSPQQILRFNNEPTSPSHEIETEQMIETKRDQYKTTALKPKQSADTHTAKKSVQIAKNDSQFINILSDSDADTSENELATMNIVKRARTGTPGCQKLSLKEKKNYDKKWQRISSHQNQG